MERQEKKNWMKTKDENVPKMDCDDYLQFRANSMLVKKISASPSRLTAQNIIISPEEAWFLRMHEFYWKSVLPN